MEAVAGPPNRFNIAGFGRIFFDLFANAVDVDRDRRRFPQGFTAPDAVKEGLLAKDDARILAKNKRSSNSLLGRLTSCPFTKTRWPLSSISRPSKQRAWR